LAVVKNKSHSASEISAVPKTGANNPLVQVIELAKTFRGFVEIAVWVLRK
jgi:hypothetical protein